MVNYADAKIYRIVDNSTGLQYIGSTTQSLAKRMHEHRADYRIWVKHEKNYLTSFKILETGREKIELIEKCDVSSRDELRAREGHWIRELDCVNKNVAGRTWKEYNQLPEVKKRNKEYHQLPEVRERNNRKERERRATDSVWRESKNSRATDTEYREKLKAREATPEVREKRAREKREKPRIACEFCECIVRSDGMKRHQQSKRCLKAQAAKAEAETPKPIQDPVIEQKREWKQEPIRCEVCGATTTKGNYAQHKKAKYCLEAAAAKAEQGL